jgi:hypothetical protein
MASISRLIQSYPARVRAQAASNGKEAAAFVQARLKDRLNTPYPPASRPGEFPHRRSGRLQREAYAVSGVVGSSVVITVAMPTPYAEPLHRMGRIGPRAVVDQTRAQVEQILLRKGYGNLERRHGG